MGVILMKLSSTWQAIEELCNSSLMRPQSTNSTRFSRSYLVIMAAGNQKRYTHSIAHLEAGMLQLSISAMLKLQIPAAGI